MGIREMLERRRMRKAFKAYVNPETIAKLLAEPMAPPQTKYIQFVAILVEQSKPKEVSSIIGFVRETIFEHRATVFNLPPLLLGVHGAPFPENNTPEKRRELVNALLEKHGEQIRIAHGDGEAEVGLVGGEKRSFYGVVIPQFTTVLRKLLDGRPGTAVEIS